MSNKYPPRPNLVYQIGEDVSDANGIAELAIRHLVSQQGISAKLSNLLEALDDQQQAADRQLHVWVVAATSDAASESSRHLCHRHCHHRG